MTAQAELRLLLPLAPQQAQMREVQLVRQKRQQPLGMKLGKADAIRSRRIGSDKQREKMFVNFDGEIAQPLLVRGQEAACDCAVGGRASGCPC